MTPSRHLGQRSPSRRSRGEGAFVGSFSCLLPAPCSHNSPHRTSPATQTSSNRGRPTTRNASSNDSEDLAHNPMTRNGRPAGWTGPATRTSSNEGKRRPGAEAPGININTARIILFQNDNIVSFITPEPRRLAFSPAAAGAVQPREDRSARHRARGARSGWRWTALQGLPCAE